MAKPRRVVDVTGAPRSLRHRTGGIRRVIHRTDNAMEVIGSLSPGDRITGVTGGQFSAIDILEHMVDELGPADVAITAWTSGIYDAQRARKFAANGRINAIRIMLDRTTFEKSPQYAGLLVEVLGTEAFRCAAIHSKIIIVSGERGSAVMRGSMGLNKNTRTEQFDIDVCDEVHRFYLGWFDALWEESGKSLTNGQIMARVYDRFVEMGRPQAKGWGEFDGDGEETRERIAAVQRRHAKVQTRRMQIEDIEMSDGELDDFLAGDLEGF